jgi:hypothetical protein
MDNMLAVFEIRHNVIAAPDATASASASSIHLQPRQSSGHELACNGPYEASASVIDFRLQAIDKREYWRSQWHRRLALLAAFNPASV